MYDLHVHIIGHDPKIKDYSVYIDHYLLQAECMNLEALGFVDHYPYRIRNVQKIRAKIEYYKTHADIPILYGAEIYLPSSTRIPTYFDYSLGHTRRGYTLDQAFKMAQQKNIDIIAHPCAYGAHCSDSCIEQFKTSGIALEISEKGLLYFPQWLYERAVELDIPLTLGSDAHTPEEMGFSDVVERGLTWTPLHKIPFVEESGWL
jgi:histidinol phosphatase-like PHP family hydrolase